MFDNRVRPQKCTHIMVIQNGADILFLIPVVAYKMRKHLIFI